MKLVILVGIVAVLTTLGLDRKGPEQNLENYVLLIDEKSIQPEPVSLEKGETQAIEISLKTEQGTVPMSLEEYLHGVVLSEMLPFFHEEALKAQAVAARTFASKMLQSGKHEEYDLCTSPSCCQAWKSDAQLRKNLGSAFDEAEPEGGIPDSPAAGTPGSRYADHVGR